MGLPDTVKSMGVSLLEIVVVELQYRELRPLQLCVAKARRSTEWQSGSNVPVG